MEKILINLAILHYRMGLIGVNECEERIDIARWISDDASGICNDPRKSTENETEFENDESSKTEKNDVVATISDNNSENYDEAWIEFLFMGLWVFTKSDEDSYPSVPHGHYKNQNRRWPKLNPYTGRAYKDKEQEDVKLRLDKKQMRILWRDKKFRSFCREMLVWYTEQHPYYEFDVKYPMRLPIWN